MKIFHTPNSRSVRAAWLFEELGLPYDLEIHALGGRQDEVRRVSRRASDGAGAGGGRRGCYDFRGRSDRRIRARAIRRRSPAPRLLLAVFPRLSAMLALRRGHVDAAGKHHRRGNPNSSRRAAQSDQCRPGPKAVESDARRRRTRPRRQGMPRRRVFRRRYHDRSRMHRLGAARRRHLR